MNDLAALIFASEDSRSMIAARLQAAGAVMDRVEIVTHVGDPPRSFYLPDDVPALAAKVRESRVKLVYFDSLFNHFAPGLAPKNPQDARIVMSALADLTHETGVTALAVRHWGKELRSAASRGLGATELTNVARSVLAVARHADSPDTYVLAPSKRNYGKAVPSQTYRIESREVLDPHGKPIIDDDGIVFTVGRIVWGDSEWISADDLAMPKADSPDDKARLEAADDFLRDLLADGPKPADAITAAAEKAGISRPTIYRAKKRLQIKSERQGFPATSTWSL